MNFNVECVWCKTKSDFDKLQRSFNYDLAISYADIYNKLLKSDPYNQEPSDVIISLYIHKLIKKNIELKQEANQENLSIGYLFTYLDVKAVDRLNNFMSNLLENKFQLNLNIINRSDIPSREVLSKFNNVRFINND